MSAVQLLRDGAMLRADERGDVDGGTASGAAATGLFAGDVRIASLLRLELTGRELVVVAREIALDRHRVVLVPELPRGETGDVVATRTQRLGAEGLHGALALENPTAHAVRLRARLEVATDFADPFALRATRVVPAPGAAVRTSTRLGDDAVRLDHAGEAGFTASTLVRAPGARVEVDGAGVVSAEWELELAARVTATLTYTVTAPGIPAGDDAPLPASPRGDLAALRLSLPELPGLRLVGAGAPWFLTLFGRDSLLTARLAGDAAPGLLDDTLRALAATQAHAADARTLAQPGRIVHELRISELAVTGRVPYRRYYGSIDATPLFLVGLGDASPAVAHALEPAARSAAGWLVGALGDGFLAYASDPHGLLHQGWKDSADAVLHADGAPADGPFALVEVQGYAYEALTVTARLAREVWGDPAWAGELDGIARRLRTRFRAAFWMPEHGIPALALDGAGRRVAVVSSDPGHLLGTGLLDADDERAIADRLLADDMWSGWGVRTLAASATAYHPLSYHNGSVWPHDTMVTAVGMARAGLANHAHRLAAGVADATAAFDGRLPELFGGFARTDHPVPVAYPYAARPQAWAAAASIAAERILGAARA